MNANQTARLVAYLREQTDGSAARVAARLVAGMDDPALEQFLHELGAQGREVLRLILVEGEVK